MSKNIKQIFDSSPASSMLNTDLMYLGRSPFSPADDYAITWANIISSIGSLNFSYVANNQLGVEQLGLGSEPISVSDGDFSGGEFTIPNPWPRVVIVSSSVPGNVIKLPDASETDAPALGTGPLIIALPGFEDVGLQNFDGDDLVTINSPDGFYATSNDRSTSAGSWSFVGLTTSVNDISGRATIDLQSTYDFGDGTVTIEEGKPFAFKKNVGDEGAGVLLPSFTTAEIDALSNFNNSEMMWDSDLDRIVVNANTAMDVRKESVAYLSDIEELEEDAVYGEMYFTGNSTPTSIAVMGTPVKVTGTYVAGDLLGFTHSNGTLTCTSPVPRAVKVTIDDTTTYNGSSNYTSIYIALNGSVIAKSKQTDFVGGVTPATQSVPVQAIIPAIEENDQLEVWIANEDGTDDPIVQDVNFIVSSIGGTSSGAGITVVGEDYLDYADNVLTANPIDLTGTNVNGILKTASTNALTGDVVKATGTLVTDLAVVNADVGTFGDSTHVSRVTVDAKGRVLGASNVLIPVKNQTLAVSIEPRTSYTSFNNTWVDMTTAYIGFNTVPANTFVSGEMVELSITGITESITSGGSGTLRVIFGSTVLATSVTATSSTGGVNSVRNWSLNFRITCTDTDEIAATASGWYEDDSHVMHPLRLYITPTPMAFDLTVDNDVNVQFMTSFTGGNGYNFVAANHCIVKYKT